jgi:hypothetical protein
MVDIFKSEGLSSSGVLSPYDHPPVYYVVISRIALNGQIGDAFGNLHVNRSIYNQSPNW